MSERTRLPNRRAAESFAFRCGGMRYVATIARFDDGRLAEVFLTAHKVGSDADTSARDAAITCSIALQYGADVETIQRALLRNRDGGAAGPLAMALDLLEGRRG